MKFEQTKVFNFEGAFRGMRNPKESWDRSDSFFGFIDIEGADIDYTIANYWAQLKYPGYQFLAEDNPDAEKLVYKCDEWLIKNGILEIDPHGSHALVALIGPNDMQLA